MLWERGNFFFVGHSRNLLLDFILLKKLKVFNIFIFHFSSFLFLYLFSYFNGQQGVSHCNFGSIRFLVFYLLVLINRSKASGSNKNLEDDLPWWWREKEGRSQEHFMVK